MPHTRELIVAGFHRSGTSFAMSILAAAGVRIGEVLIGAAKSNPRGHFEDKEIVTFHNDLLADNGRTWQVDEPFVPIVTTHRWEQMRTMVARRRAGEGPWGFKDPRVCLFLPLWKHVMPEAKVVIAYRNRDEVIDSLLRRHADGLERGVADPNIHRRFFDDPTLALRMWVAHNEALLDFAAAHPADVMAVSFARLSAGFPLAAAVERRWGLGIAPVDTTAMFDASITTAIGPQGEPSHDSLEARASAITVALRALEDATCDHRHVGTP